MTDKKRAEKYLYEIVAPKKIEVTVLNANREIKNAYIAGLKEGRKELEKEHNLLTDIIETFTSQSLTDDIEMANTAREIAEILEIKNYR